MNKLFHGASKLKVLVGMIVSGFIGAIVIAGLVVAWIAIPSALASHASVPDRRLAALTVNTVASTEVPSILPVGGVVINHQFLLKPPTALQMKSGLLTQYEAITAGRKYAETQPAGAAAILTSFTSINSIAPANVKNASRPIQDVIAWVVTFTTDNPQDVIQGGRSRSGQIQQSHVPKYFNVVIDANNGQFVIGFFTS
ncbi:hypothetical protein [Tengunoibacter tsumagoiensis]|uniref:Uncharacterized protein n=1 Tax=Tengunoibacter tsumagoiensis TaxID=2014871 RepID=A0A402A3Z3_9CHLR|nr:hypothetical protein [Tengunoibacter tsumagoiensis]GCE13874.1 hypothetical protein KTT_37330 [Tengunoibacter tsumagoiensis]